MREHKIVYKCSEYLGQHEYPLEFNLFLFDDGTFGIEYSCGVWLEGTKDELTIEYSKGLRFDYCIILGEFCVDSPCGNCISNWIDKHE